MTRLFLAAFVTGGLLVVAPWAVAVIGSIALWRMLR